MYPGIKVKGILYCSQKDYSMKGSDPLSFKGYLEVSKDTAATFRVKLHC